MTFNNCPHKKVEYLSGNGLIKGHFFFRCLSCNHAGEGNRDTHTGNYTYLETVYERDGDKYPVYIKRKKK